MDMKKSKMLNRIKKKKKNLWSNQAMAHTHSNEMDEMHCSYS